MTRILLTMNCKEMRMKPIMRLFAALMMLSLGMLACNLPSTTSATSQPTVQTIPTATPSTPIVTVSSATNCRAGPGPSYALVLVFQPGATAEVVGKYTPSNYWIIMTPTGGTCWLKGTNATVQGNVAALAEMAPPTPGAVAVVSTSVPTLGSNSGSVPNPTATTKPLPNPTATTKPLILPPLKITNPILIENALKPAAPSKLTVSPNCQYTPFPFKVLIFRTDFLSWTSVSGATGYYVYMSGSKIATVTTTSYSNTATLTESAITYGVAAYNSFGSSGTTSASGHC